jgi:hypothetical protein
MNHSGPCEFVKIKWLGWLRLSCFRGDFSWRFGRCIANLCLLVIFLNDLLYQFFRDGFVSCAIFNVLEAEV